MPGIETIGKPLGFVEETVQKLNGKEALDIAAGRGRHTRVLLNNGYAVTAIEYDDGKCSSLADSYPACTVVKRDVEEKGLPSDWSERFDLVVMTYFLWRPLFVDIARVLKPGGSFLLETFHMENHLRRGKPGRQHFALEAEEGAQLVLQAGLEVVLTDEGERGDVYSSRVWARKPPPATLQND